MRRGESVGRRLGGGHRSHPGYTRHMTLRPISCLEPIELTESDAAEIAELYARCSDYFLLQDGEAATLAMLASFSQTFRPRKRLTIRLYSVGWGVTGYMRSRRSFATIRIEARGISVS